MAAVGSWGDSVWLIPINERDSRLLNRCPHPIAMEGNFLEGPAASKPYERERLQVCDALRCPGPHVRYSRGDNVRRCLGRRAG
ncbi:hypothetical protein TNCT_497851 [Trichonephila clavata]|uniref:Uncharacterized protein n=1 Tax=Trichonephila clavata TaxID=2740835 RepID=A0A8X6G5R7_TRICU|nr:hypothetical protein TNCT_497851 [Trichonephila clavata]